MRRTSSTVAWVSATLMPGGRLVEAQELGLGGQRDADLEVALLAVREVRRQLVLLAREADRGQHGARPRSITSRRRGGAEQAPAVAARLGGDAHVLQHGGAGQDVGDLVRAGDALARDACGRQPGDVLAVEEDPARGGPEHAGQAVEEGGLPGAVGPDDGADLAGGAR